MKLVMSSILTVLLLNSLVQCSTSRFLPGTRSGEIAEFFNGSFDIVHIIGDYDADSCLESRSQKYYAYVQHPHQWNGSVVLCNRSGVELQRFYASYIRAIALSSREDIIMVMHEKSKGSWCKGHWCETPYRYITANLFWCSLALTGFSILDGTSHTFWPSWYTQQTIKQVEFFRQINTLDPHLRRPSDPVMLPFNGPLTHKKEHQADTSHWPDMSHARIKRMRIADDDTFSVTLHDPIPLLNIYQMNKTPTSCTRKLTVPGQYCLEKMRRRLQEKR